MSRDLVVKVCGITSEADALLAVGLGADAVGFIFAPSPRQVTTTLVADVVKRLPLGVLTVGIFRDEAPGRVVEVVNHIGLGAVQLHGREPAEQCRWIRQRVPMTIKGFSAGERAIARFDEFGADYLLIDGPSPGSGEVFDWRLAEGVVDPRRLIVAGGLNADNVGDAISHLHPFGVDVDSGVEAEPGRKDPKKVAAFVAAARAAAALLGGDGDDADPDGAGGPYDWMDS
jgi:phosphoribosylanthranilate isomerase